MTQVEARIRGDVSGQLAVGSHIVQVHAEQGAVVTVAAPEEAPEIRPVPTPVLIRPSAFPNLLDRRSEVDAAVATLRSVLPVEIFGGPGVGKTSVLRYLAYAAPSADFPSGIVCLPARLPATDLLQALFDSFFEADVRVKPTEMQMRRLLADRRALVLVDDVELGLEEVDELLDAAPGCAFLLASSERRLWREGRSLALPGLPADDALALVGRELGREVTPGEREGAKALCAALGGHPLRIRQAVALATSEGRSLAEAAAQLAPGGEDPSRRLLVGLTEDELKVVRALAVAGHAAVPEERIAELAGLADATDTLSKLERLGIVQSASPSYRLTGDLAERVRTDGDLGEELDRAAAVYGRLGHDEPWQRVADAADAVLGTIELASARSAFKIVLLLARAVDEALLLSGRWGSWSRVLGSALEAARATGDAREEGWALHQLGSRALALGDAHRAVRLLEWAALVREGAGDPDGAALSRRNLQVARTASPPPIAGELVRPPRPRPRRLWQAAGLAAAAAAGGVVAIVASHAIGATTTTTTVTKTAPVRILATTITRRITTTLTITSSGLTTTSVVTTKTTIPTTTTISTTNPGFRGSSSTSSSLTTIPIG